MNEAIKKFKISNMPDSYTAFLIPGSIMVFIVGGGLTLCSLGLSAYIPDVLIGWIAFILIILGFGTPFLICAGMKAEITYDGKHIKVNSVLKKQEIDLEHVKSITYWHEPGSGRHRVDGITVEFTFYKGEDDEEKTIELYDTLGSGDDDRTDIDKLIKGDHSDFPLLLLYDDIIEMYPDKKAEEDKEED
jgi:hypothetical protein